MSREERLSIVNNLTRRGAITAILSFPLGYYQALKANAGILTLDLNQWTAIRVSYRGKVVTLPAQDIFNALQEECDDAEA